MIFYKIYFLKLKNKKICTIVSGTNLLAVSVLCFIATKVSILICLILLYNWTFFQKISIKDTAQSQIWGPQTAYRTVSIKWPGLEFLQKSLLNVPYNQKNGGLNTLLYRTYNRVMRVRGTTPSLASRLAMTQGQSRPNS